MEFGLSLGSNQGDRQAHMARGRTLVAGHAGIRLLAQSRLYRTEPVDVPPAYRDRDFLNAVIVIESGLSPRALMGCLRGFEADAGRVRTSDRNAPRPLDIDILYADELCVRDGDLVLPHPRWAERRFVVQPLADVRPDRVLPGAGGTVREILLSLPARPEVLVWAENW